MGMLSSLYVKLGLKNKEFVDKLNESKNKTTAFGNVARKVGGIVAGAFAFTSIIAGFKKFISVNAEFEQSMASLSSITGATGKDLEYYKEQAIELGAKTTLSASQVAKGFELMGSAKPDLMKSKEALAEVTKEAITLAEAAGLDLPTATGALAKALNQFNLPASEAGRVVNVLAAGSKFGAEAIPGIADAIKVMGTSAQMAGVSLEESVGMIEVLAEKGLSGAESGTQLRNVLLKLQSEADHLNPKVVGVQKALENLSKENLTAAELTTKFGLRNQQAAAILMQSTDKLKYYTDAVTGTTVAYEQQAINTSTLIASYKAFQSAIEGVILSFRESNGVLKGWLDNLTLLIHGIRENKEEITKYLKIIGRAVVIYGTIAAALKIYTVVTNLASKATKGLALGWRGLNAAMKANIIIAIITAVVSLIMYVRDLWKESEVFRAKTKYVTASVAAFFQKAWIKIKMGAEMMWLGIKSYFTAIPKLAKAVWNIVKRVIKGENIGKVIKEEMTAMVADIGAEAKNIKSKYQEQLDAIEPPSYQEILDKEKAVQAAEEVGQEIAETITETIESAPAAKMKVEPIFSATRKDTTVRATTDDEKKRQEENSHWSASLGLQGMDGIKETQAERLKVLQDELKAWEDFKDGMAKVVEDFANDVVYSFANSMGEMIASGNIDPGELGKQLLAQIGNLIASLGKMLITLGTGALGFQKLLATGLTNPVSAGLAIAAGAALVALGGAISSKAQSAAGGSSGGSPTTDTRGSYRDMADMQQNVIVSVEGILRGTDMQISNERTVYRNNAIG